MNKTKFAAELLKLAKSLLSETDKVWSQGEWDSYKKEHPDTKIKPKIKKLEHEKPVGHHEEKVKGLMNKSNKELEDGSDEHRHLSNEAMRNGDKEVAKHHDAISKQHDVAHHLKNNPRVQDAKPIIRKMFE